MACLLGACSPSPTGLAVDLRTDYVPGVDFVGVQTEVSTTPFASPTASGIVSLSPALTGSDYVHGVRVDDRADLAAGDWWVRVTLVAASGARVAQRAVTIRTTGRYVLTLVVARSCEGVTCPSALDPGATECSGGRCVDPHCSVETIASCGSLACRNDVDCTPPGECARTSCAAGVCLAAAAPELCGGGTCAQDYTCVGRGDAGPRDAGSRDAGSRDAGPADADPCEGVPPVSAFADVDGDGFGDPASAASVCPGTSGYVASPGDCCDADPQVRPDQTAFFDVPSAACGGRWDYDCDGTDELGPTPGPLGSGCRPSTTFCTGASECGGGGWEYAGTCGESAQRISCFCGSPSEPNSGDGQSVESQTLGCR